MRSFESKAFTSKPYGDITEALCESGISPEGIKELIKAYRAEKGQVTIVDLWGPKRNIVLPWMHGADSYVSIQKYYEEDLAFKPSRQINGNILVPHEQKSIKGQLQGKNVAPNIIFCNPIFDDLPVETPKRAVALLTGFLNWQHTLLAEDGICITEIPPFAPAIAPQYIGAWNRDLKNLLTQFFQTTGIKYWLQYQDTPDKQSHVLIMFK